MNAGQDTSGKDATLLQEDADGSDSSGYILNIVDGKNRRCWQWRSQDFSEVGHGSGEPEKMCAN